MGFFRFVLGRKKRDRIVPFLLGRSGLVLGKRIDSLGIVFRKIHDYTDNACHMTGNLK